ncbi:hypothetical protein GALMADRAFT_243751, partial [Galerina marginata CBS 339.88]
MTQNGNRGLSAVRLGWKSAALHMGGRRARQSESSEMKLEAENETPDEKRQRKTNKNGTKNATVNRPNV